MMRLNFGILGSLLSAAALYARPSMSNNMPSSIVDEPFIPMAHSGGYIGRGRPPRSSRHMPHQSDREVNRRRKQVAEGKIHFIQHGPKK